jgi:hypothetical protein
MLVVVWTFQLIINPISKLKTRKKKERKDEEGRRKEEL